MANKPGSTLVRVEVAPGDIRSLSPKEAKKYGELAATSLGGESGDEGQDGANGTPASADGDAREDEGKASKPVSVPTSKGARR